MLGLVGKKVVLYVSPPSPKEVCCGPMLSAFQSSGGVVVDVRVRALATICKFVVVVVWWLCGGCVVVVWWVVAVVVLVD